MKARYEQGDWSVTGAFKFAKRMTKVPNNDMVQTSGWGTVDLFTDYDFGVVKLNAGIFNLFDKAYTPYESVAGQAADADLTQFTQPGRNFAFNAKMTF